MKRKANDNNHAHVGSRPPKRPRQAAGQSPTATPSCIQHPVLSRLYPKVVSLRHYLLSRLPASSKNRRRKIAHLGVQQGPDQQDGHTAPHGTDAELGKLLDATLIGVVSKHVTDDTAAIDIAKERDQDLKTFSQHLSSSRSTGGTFKQGYFLQKEVSHYLIICHLCLLFPTVPALKALTFCNC